MQSFTTTTDCRGIRWRLLGLMFHVAVAILFVTTAPLHAAAAKATQQCTGSLSSTSTAFLVLQRPSGTCPSRRRCPDSPASPSTGHNERIHSFALFAKKNKKKKKEPDRTVAVNRIAYRNYEILEKLEAGISLKGTEVKSIRDGKLNLRDGFVRPSKNGRSCTLFNVHIGKCTNVGAEYFQHEETRPRDLLVHKSEALRLKQKTEQMGMTVVPLRAYWNDHRNSKLKIEIALCKGKNVRDKRSTIRERDEKRESNRIIKNFRI